MRNFQISYWYSGFFHLSLRNVRKKIILFISWQLPNAIRLSIQNSMLWNEFFFPYISHKNLNFHSSNIIFFTIRRNINGKWKFKWYKRRNSERNKRLFWMFLRYHRFISIWTIWRWHQQLPSQFHHSPFCFYFCFNSIAIFFLGVSQRKLKSLMEFLKNSKI